MPPMPKHQRIGHFLVIRERNKIAHKIKEEHAEWSKTVNQRVAGSSPADGAKSSALYRASAAPEAPDRLRHPPANQRPCPATTAPAASDTESDRGLHAPGVVTPPAPACGESSYGA